MGASPRWRDSVFALPASRSSAPSVPDPAFRGRGYAAALITILTADIWSQGRTPMLHVMTDNVAKRLYERLGFSVRRMIRFSLVGQR